MNDWMPDKKENAGGCVPAPHLHASVTQWTRVALS
jgi:hypothetical protein